MLVRITGFLCLFLPVLCGAWDLDSGEKLDGVPTAFNFDGKSVIFFNRLSQIERTIPVDELDLRSRQKLLLSPVFHHSYPDVGNWPDEKRRLLIFALLAPTVSLFLGFWLAGWFVAGKFNPILALFGFLGSWLIGGLLIFCYLMFAEMTENKTPVVAGGAIVSTILVAIFVSAVYSCSFIKGLAVFLLQSLAAICVTALGLLLFGIVVPDEQEERIWRELVFVPVGLQEKSDSNQLR